MLYKTNILFIVGGGPIPRYPPNKVVVWDQNLKKFLGEMTFKSCVRAVKVRYNR